MKSCLAKEEYKKHPFAVGLFLYYLLSIIISVVLLDLLSGWIISSWFDTFKGFKGFFSTIISAAFILVGCGILCLLVYLFIPKEKIKPQRAIGLNVFMKIVAIASPIAFVILIIVLNVAKIEHSFINSVALLIEFLTPLFITLILKKRTTPCKNCGLVNTFEFSDRATTDFGKHHKFHNEGGYRRTTKTSFGVIVQDVPTTTVYDGEFEKWGTTTYYKCSVCENIKIVYTTHERKIN